MIVVFLVVFVLGLVLGVRAMLFGVERDSASVSVAYPNPAAGAPTVRYWMPVVAGFATTFGLVGYLLLRTGATGVLAGTVIALVAGVVAAFALVRMVGRAIAFVPEHDPDDPRYILQGHVAQVTAPIRVDADGEIVFEIGEGEHRRVPARGIEGSSAEVGSEVVIEKIEDGVAYVEPWVQVEKRL